jgi:hypothetical protein
VFKIQFMCQALRQARAQAILDCSDIPNISSLPARRIVTFDYRGFRVPLKVSCLEEQVSLAFASAVKGIAVETGMLQPIFAEE